MRLVIRIVLIVALIALIGVNAVRHGPEVAAALQPKSTPSAPPRAAAPESSAPASKSASAAPSVSASVSAPPVVSTGSGGSSGGGSSGGGGGTVTTPKPKKASVDSLSATDVACPDPDAPVNSGGGMSPTSTVSWSTSNAETVYVGINTDDAAADPYSRVSASGSVEIHWACGDATEGFAVTAVGADGSKVTKTTTAQNTGAKY